MNEKLKYNLYGLVMVVVVALFVTFTVAAYRKVFTPVSWVTLDVDHTGSQLAAGADVKVRGVLVGEVREISSAGDGAVLKLAMQPDKLSLIPANVTAQLLPKTLFGERYVALQIPAAPAGARLKPGDTISQDRSSTAIEVEKVLGDVMPLLQAVQPQKLADTLNAVSSALSGEGPKLGQTMVSLENYLKQIDPSLPNLDADIRAITSVADTYDKAAPQLLNALNELTTTSKTIVDEQGSLQNLYGAVTTSSIDLQNFMQVNENNIIDLAGTSTPTLNVLARYAPEYPCLLQQIVHQIPATDLAFGKGTSHPDAMKVTIVIASSRGKYIAGQDTPEYNDDRGPMCYHQDVPPARSPEYPPGGAINDGSTHPPPENGTWDGNLQDLLSGATSTSSADSTGTSAASSTPQVANSPAEQQLISTLLAPGLGLAPSDVPDWASILVGPLFRGTEVTLK
ncbi:MAG TPA: MCE family protein [Pseudonocardiaceae bacterium]|jgi:virulence factor Mce-like protein|nr:MCE family protein [Pseudonocardiaceae bacterium]